MYPVNNLNMSSLDPLRPNRWVKLCWVLRQPTIQQLCLMGFWKSKTCNPTTWVFIYANATWCHSTSELKSVANFPECLPNVGRHRVSKQKHQYCIPVFVVLVEVWESRDWEAPSNSFFSGYDATAPGPLISDDINSACSTCLGFYRAISLLCVARMGIKRHLSKVEISHLRRRSQL